MIMRTPRDMKRVLNKALISAEHVRSEVNFADVLAFETLHLRFPKVFELIHRRPAFVNPSEQPDEEVANEVVSAMARSAVARRSGKEKKDGRRKLEDVLRLYPQSEETLGPLLEFLFPNIFSDMSVREDPDPIAARRVSIHENLLKLLYQGVRGEVFSAKDAVSFLTEPEMRMGFLADAVESGTAAGWIRHMASFARSVEIPDGPSLVLDVARAVNLEFSRAGVDVSSDMRWSLITIINYLKESERWSALEAILTTPDTALVGEEVLTALLRDVGLWENGQYFGTAKVSSSAHREFKWLDAERLDALREQWLKTIRGIALSDVIAKYPNAGGVLFRWGQLTNPPYEEVRLKLERALELSDVALSYVLLFPPGIGLEGTEKLLTQKALESVLEAANSPSVPSAIRDRFGEYFQEIDNGSTHPQGEASG
jgi:hypothetical protein